jgi:hypothetical protein
MDGNVSKCICWSCGAEIAAWWDDLHALFDVAADDAAYERWRDTPCPSCGKTPREGDHFARAY